MDIWKEATFSRAFSLYNEYEKVANIQKKNRICNENALCYSTQSQILISSEIEPIKVDE